MFQLNKYGYVNIDGLDSNEEMLKECEKTGIYNKLMHCHIGPEPMNIPDSEFTMKLINTLLVICFWFYFISI